MGLSGLTLFVLFFVGGVEVASRHIDGPVFGAPGVALLIDVGLVVVFGLQHSVMARRRFKEAWTRVIPPAIERSVYALLSGLLLVLICLCWQPIGGSMWRVEGQVAWVALVVLQVSGWALAVAASLQVGHFEMFGLEQVFSSFARTDKALRAVQ